MRTWRTWLRAGMAGLACAAAGMAGACAVDEGGNVRLERNLGRDRVDEEFRGALKNMPVAELQEAVDDAAQWVIRTAPEIDEVKSSEHLKYLYVVEADLAGDLVSDPTTGDTIRGVTKSATDRFYSELSRSERLKGSFDVLNALTVGSNEAVEQLVNPNVTSGGSVIDASASEPAKRLAEDVYIVRLTVNVNTVSTGERDRRRIEFQVIPTIDWRATQSTVRSDRVSRQIEWVNETNLIGDRSRWDPVD